MVGKLAINRAGRRTTLQAACTRLEVAASSLRLGGVVLHLLKGGWEGIKHQVGAVHGPDVHFLARQSGPATASQLQTNSE